MAPDSVASAVASPVASSVVSSVVAFLPLLALLGDGPTPFCELVRPDALLATQRGLAETSPGYRLPHLKAALARGWVAVAAVPGEPAGEETRDGPPDAAWPHYRAMALAALADALPPGEPGAWVFSLTPAGGRVLAWGLALLRLPHDPLGRYRPLPALSPSPEGAPGGPDPQAPAPPGIHRPLGGDGGRWRYHRQRLLAPCPLPQAPGYHRALLERLLVAPTEWLRCFGLLAEQGALSDSEMQGGVPHLLEIFHGVPHDRGGVLWALGKMPPEVALTPLRALGAELLTLASAATFPPTPTQGDIGQVLLQWLFSYGAWSDRRTLPGDEAIFHGLRAWVAQAPRSPAVEHLAEHLARWA